jgi:two-component system, cell cycle sensor histidine kinase and response regulator CckA
MRNAQSIARDALDAMLSHICVLDDQGTIVLTNTAWKAFADANDCSWQAVSEGTSYLGVCRGAERAKAPEAEVVASAIEDVLAGLKDEFRIEYPCHSPSAERYFVLRMTGFSQRRRRYVVISHVDVTASRRAEAGRLAAEQQFERLFDSAPDAMVFTDQDGTVQLFNDQAEAVFGYARAEIVGQPIERLVPFDQSARHVALRRQYVATARARPMGPGMKTLRGRRKDGTTFPAEVSLSPNSTPAGQGVIAAVRDVSDREELESRLAQAQKMETVGRLAGGVAHDFNNILSVINGAADLALLDVGEDDPLRNDLVAIRSAGERAAALTQQLLAFSRRQIVQPVFVDFEALMNSLAPIMQRLIGEAIKIVVSLQHDLWPVFIDPTQLEQVLLNLAANARDAMPDGGVLTITAANVTLGAADLASGVELVPGPHVSIAVSDTGVGIAEEIRARIFEPFFTTKSTGKGTGLGLATVFGIAKQCGGDIACESVVGAGTTFRMFLPRREGNAPAVLRRDSSDQCRVILVVEDDDSVRAIAARMLTRKGFVVLLASGAEEALGIFRSRADEIDLVLTDVVMPGKSGRELAEELKAIAPDTKIVFASGYTDDALLRHGVSAEGQHFIRKPYSLPTLLARVREALS